MTFVLVTIAGVLAGWSAGSIWSYVTGRQLRREIEQLQAHHVDQIEWDEHTSGGRRG